MSLAGYLPVLLATIVVICAIAAGAGFRGRVTAVGVDLGTTYSVVAVNQGNGNIVVVSGDDGDPLLPSVVSYLEGGKLVVGREALEKLEKNPASTFYGAKRFIGRDAQDYQWRKQAEGHHFEVVSNMEDVSGAWFSLDVEGHPREVSPQEVGSEVLKGLKTWACNFLGHQQVNKAVIAVPAKFTARQIEATIQAFAAAGLKVIRVLEEPTAAAMAYGLDKRKDVHHVLVYDFGGGTLDVSMLYMHAGSVEVLGSEGDENLGGSDLDRCLSKVISLKLAERTVSHDAAIAAASAGCQFQQPICVDHMMTTIAEFTKRELTDSDKTLARCMTLLSGESGGVCGDWVVANAEVSRAEFEQGCDALFQRAMLPVDRLLENLNMKADEIDEVVCVGGTTRVPHIRSMLKDHLKLNHLNTEIDPDITVAWGAATIAH